MQTAPPSYLARSSPKLANPQKSLGQTKMEKTKKDGEFVRSERVVLALVLRVKSLFLLLCFDESGCESCVTQGNRSVKVSKAEFSILIIFSFRETVKSASWLSLELPSWQNSKRHAVFAAAPPQISMWIRVHCG